MEKMDGVLVGLDEVSICQGVRAEEGRIHVEGILPGRYLLLTRSGCLSVFEIDGEHAVAYLGRADLTVSAKPGTRIYVIPAVEDELIPLFGGRVSSQRVLDSGRVRIAPLPEGRYHVGIDRRGIFAAVNVDGPGAEVEID